MHTFFLHWYPDTPTHFSIDLPRTRTLLLHSHTLCGTYLLTKFPRAIFSWYRLMRNFEFSSLYPNNVFWPPLPEINKWPPCFAFLPAQDSLQESFFLQAMMSLQLPELHCGCICSLASAHSLWTGCSFSQACPPALASHFMLSWPLSWPFLQEVHCSPSPTHQSLSGQQPAPLPHPEHWPPWLLHLLEDGAQFVALCSVPRTNLPRASHTAGTPKEDFHLFLVFR